VCGDEGWKNPCVEHLKQPATIRPDKPTVSYLRALAAEFSMPCNAIILSSAHRHESPDAGEYDDREPGDATMPMAVRFRASKDARLGFVRARSNCAHRC